ncbi:hypothetical protein CEXT_523861 [Caerostris extrusa]|uniref:Uncharacterized protein n=1 Tax=Caerostris extrusa TaxID=172846 RepID=A0AAV4XQH8_CAEEX|nr:hypothetical protein CEXT_523861 [Caerostris extrusa]
MKIDVLIWINFAVTEKGARFNGCTPERTPDCTRRGRSISEWNTEEMQAAAGGNKAFCQSLEPTIFKNTGLVDRELERTPNARKMFHTRQDKCSQMQNTSKYNGCTPERTPDCKRVGSSISEWNTEEMQAAAGGTKLSVNH